METPIPQNKDKLIEITHAASATYTNMFATSVLPGGMIKVVCMENNHQINISHTRMAFVTDPNNISSLIQLLNQTMQNLHNLQKNLNPQSVDIGQANVAEIKKES